MLHCRIVKIWKHVDVSFGVFEYEVSPGSRAKRSDHSLGDGRFCFLILCRWKVNLFLLRAALKKLVGELETTIRIQKQRLQPASALNFCKGFENRLVCLALQRLSPCTVWKLFNNNQHERVTVIEHFRIWQVNQIILPLIINATGDSATAVEITTNKAMQRVPWCTVRWWRVRTTISKPVTMRSVVFEKTRQDQSVGVKSTCAIANILKIGVAPTRNQRIKTVKDAVDRFYSEIIRLC